MSISIADSPRAWTAFGFAVDTSGWLNLGATAIQLVGGDGGVLGWEFGSDPDEQIQDAGEIDGIALIRTPCQVVPGTTTNPNGVVSIDHVVISSDNCDASRAAFETAGFPVRRERVTESFGTPMRQMFFWAGNVILELIGPAATGTTDQEWGSGVGVGPGERAHRPSAVFGITFVSSDLEGTCAHLGELINPPKPAVQAGRWIAGLRGRDLGISIPIAIMSPHPRST